jgi:putative transposase
MGKVTRFNLENYCHFVTSKTCGNSRIFSDGKVADLLIQTIYEVREKLRFKLIGFVVMPDHIHLMVVPDKKNTISDVMRHIKGRFWRRWNLLGRGMNSPGYGVPFHRTGNSSLPGPGDINRAGNSSPPKPKVWQQSFYDHVIRNRKEFDQRLDYLYNNPVKAGLVEKPEDHEYSSASGKCETGLDDYVGG